MNDDQVRVTSLCPCVGDTNGDLIHNGKDIQFFIKCLLAPSSVSAPPCLCADMNSDGYITLGDVSSFVAVILNSSPCTASTTGACCLPGNTCINTTLSNCTNQSGTFQGQGVVCTGSICNPTGACCDQFGTCTQTSSANCQPPSIYHGDGSNCGAIMCVPTGACCPPSGVCYQTTSANCTYPSDYHGDGSDCSKVMCTPTGACCPPSGVCFQSTAANCVSPQMYQGDGTDCSSTICTPTGACCHQDGTCTQTVAAACSAPNVYHGDGSECAFVICPPFMCPPAPAAPPDALAAGPNFAGRLADVIMANAITGAGMFPEAPLNLLRQDGVDTSVAANVTSVRNGIDAANGWDIRARIYYPATAAGLNQPVAGGGPFPVVVIAHGRHPPFRTATGPDPTDENYRGYQYLQQHLAQHGFISASVDLDDTFPLFPGNLSRAWMIHCNLRNLEAMNAAGSGNRLEGQMDLMNVALMGHSRGGEAVVQATRMNLDGTGPYTANRFGIAAVWSMAATRFFDGLRNYDPIAAGRQPVVAETRLHFASIIPFLGMWGAADGDVDGSGVPTVAAHVEGIYDRSDNDPKQFVWIYGANHNFWNTSWFDPTVPPAFNGDDGDGVVAAGDRITAAQQQDAARGYGLAFVRGYLRNEASIRQYFTGPANAFPVLPALATLVHLQYQNRSINLSRVDNFESNGALGTTSESATGVDTSTLSVASELSLAGAEFAASDTQSWYHYTKGLLAEWDANTDFYETVLVAGQRDVSGFQNLSFRIALDRRGTTGTNPSGSGATPALQVAVSLIDGAGRNPAFNTSAITTIPVAQARLDDPLLTKSMLKTIRMPLCRFKEVNPNLDLTDIRRIRFTLNDRAIGKVGIDDIEFAN